MNDPKRLLEDPALPGSAADLLRAIPGPPALSAARLDLLTRDLAQVAATADVPYAAAGGLKPLLVKGGAVAAGVGLIAALFASRAPTGSTQLVVPPVARAPVALVSPPPPPRAEPAVAAPTTPSPPLAAPAVTRAKTPSDRLAEEEALLEKARTASAASPGAALALLRDYQRKFPAGQLRAEQMYLMVEMLERTGDTAGAERQAQALVDRFPKSVYARRIRDRR